MMSERFKFLATLSIFVLLQLFCKQSFAGGFQISLNSQQQIAMGHTGVAMPVDASSVYFNPGGLAFTQQRSIMAGATMVDMRIQYMDETSFKRNHNEFNKTFPFSFYADWNIDSTNRWKIGFGAYTPYGNMLKWPDNWPGKYVLREIQLRTFYFQPTVSYRITEKLGVGVGLVVCFGDVLIRRALPLSTDEYESGEIQLEGRANGWGFNAGIYYALNEHVSFGASYLSRVSVAPENGKVTFTVPEALRDSFPDGGVSTRFSLPYSMTAGVNLSPNKKTDLNIDVQYTGWQTYDSLIFNFEQNTSVLPDVAEPRLYENSFTIRFGGEYRPNEQLALRAGTYFDLTPVPDGTVTPETPDANRISFSAGVGFAFSEKLKIDLSLMYIEGMSRVEKAEENFARLGGTYKGRAFLTGLGIKFLY